MKKKVLIVFFYLSIIALQIYLVSVQPICGKDMPYDDALMIDQAETIFKGKWLGTYNMITLIKGVFTPVFIATSRFIHIPFLIMQDIFYIIACISLINMLKNKIKNPIVRILIFIILLFHPIIYSEQMCRIYRDGLYLSLIIFLISFTFSLFFNRKQKASKLLKYYVAIGIAIGSIYLCREEFIWIVPYIVVAFLIFIYNLIKDKNETQKKRKLLMFLIPIVIFFIMITIVKYINYKYYGVFQLNQYWSKEFKEAYGALTRIIPDEEIEKVPVTSNALEKAYKISPKCAELKYYFDRAIPAWAMDGDGPATEIQGGWFHWALMDALEYRGYYQKAAKANTFYKEMADEINKACDEGKVECLPYKRVSNIIKYDMGDILKTILNTKIIIRYQYKLEDIKSRVSTKWRYYDRESKEIRKRKDKFEDMALNKVYSEENSYSSNEDKIRINILETIEKVYKIINPFLFYESIIVFIIFIIYIFKTKQKKTDELILLLGLVGLYLCRIFIITFTYTTMFTSALNTLYLAPSYIIQILFSLLVNVFFVQTYIERRGEIGENKGRSKIFSK